MAKGWVLVRCSSAGLTSDVSGGQAAMQCVPCLEAITAPYRLAVVHAAGHHVMQNLPLPSARPLTLEHVLQRGPALGPLRLLLVRKRLQGMGQSFQRLS